MPERFDDLPVLAALGSSLHAAMAAAEAAEVAGAPLQAHAAAEPSAAEPTSAPDRHTRRWRRAPSRFGALSTVLVLGVVGTAAAAATLTILRGSPIPAPRAADLQPAMTARAETQKVLSLRAADPAGGTTPPFALRTGESEGGLTCVTVGQADGDQFGIVGTDGRFRELPPTLVDGCGTAAEHAPAVAGARVLDAEDYDDVRTVVYGVAGEDLEGASLGVRGQQRALTVKDGAFVGVVRGYPEDHALRLRLTYGDGHTATHSLGGDSLGALDPSGPAWKLQAMVGMSDDPKATPKVCVNLFPARPWPKSPSSPPVCALGQGPRSGLQRDRWFFDMRTVRPGDGGSFDRDRAKWSWRNAPARTLIWGSVQRERVAKITVRDRARVVATRKPSINGAFAFVFEPTVDPRDLTVVFTTKDGREHAYDRPVLPIGRIDS